MERQRGFVLLIFGILIGSTYELDLEGTDCYCPGDPKLTGNYNQEEVVLILKRMSEIRRTERQNFEVYTPALPVDPRPERSNLPSEDVINKMFPLDDMVDWIEKNSITAESVQGLKDTKQADVTARLASKQYLKAYDAKFPKPPTTTTVTTTTTVITTTTAAATAVESTDSGNVTVANSTTAENGTSTDESAETSTSETAAVDNSTVEGETTAGGSRKKREANKRPEIPMVLGRDQGMGIKQGNTSALEDAVACWGCQAPSLRVRKEFLVSADPAILDLSSDAFKAFKLLMESKLDELFEKAMERGDITGSNGRPFNFEVGYYGSEVVAVHEVAEGESRRKREAEALMVEVDISAKDGGLVAADVDTVYDNGTMENISVASTSPANKRYCSVSDLDYPKTVLVLLGTEQAATVEVGLKIHFSCLSGHLLNPELDPEINGFDVMCGLGGEWEVPEAWPNSTTGCVPTPMCSTVPDTEALPTETGLMRMDYTAVDHTGAVLDGDVVFYACKENNAVLQDGSGLGVYQAKCSEGTLSPEVWPACVVMKICSDIPQPDSESAESGLSLVSSPSEPLWQDEYAVYNCSTPEKPVTETGNLYILQCRDGVVTAPGRWPLCREPAGCDMSPEKVPKAPAETHLEPNITEEAVKEMEELIYHCTATVNKTYIENNTLNQFGVKCLPGGEWEQPGPGDWPVCDDPTTTTEPPTTTTPAMKRDCYCLGDIAPSDSETWLMSTERHQEILKICRKSYVTFSRMITEVDESNNRYLVPVKEQCGVKNPYVGEYGHLQGLNRSYTYDDVCACTEAKVYGYWVTLEITSQTFDPIFTRPTSSKTRILREHIEEVMDTIYVEGREDVNGLFNKNYIRTRVMRFDMGNTILNQEDIEINPELEPERSTRVMMEVQFASVDDNIISMSDFNTTHYNLMSVNSTLSEQKFSSGVGIILNLKCNPVSNPQSLDSCPVTEPPRCYNRDFEGVPPYLTHQYVRLYENGTQMPFPFEVEEDGEKVEFSLGVGETVDFICNDPVKQFKTDDPELLDNKLTVLCKPDRYYNVPSVWPVCKAKCPAEKPLPGNDTRMEIWTDHPMMKEKLYEEFWEDDPLFYRCIDPKNEGVVLQPNLVGEDGGEVGDRRVTSQEFKCSEKGFYNTPRKFRNCAPKPEVCECLGDLTEEQSRNILNLVCRNDSLGEGNYHVSWHAEKEETGLLLLPNKTRCGVEKADYPSVKEKCYCYDHDFQGVKTGFWHIMEVLSLPWHDDLFWPNTTLFKQNKILLERELDDMYISSKLLFGKRYVRSIVFKFKKGKFLLKHQTSTTTTTTTTSTTTLKGPVRQVRAVQDDERDFFYDDNDNKVFVGKKGYWPYGEEEYSTVAWVEHQFMEDFTVMDFESYDFETEHMSLLNERNGQWLDKTNNLTLWLSQGCYISKKCLITDFGRCPNTILESLPLGFTHEKPRKMVPVSRDSPDLKEEYKLPVGAEVNIKCSEHHQKITSDKWDSNPNDKLLTVKCLPNFKYDIPTDGFPRCRSYCPAPRRLWNITTMKSDTLPLQKIYTEDPSLTFREATHPEVGYRQLKPSSYAGLILNEEKTDLDEETWEGEKIYYVCINSSLGVEQAESPEIAFRCRDDGVYNVPENNSWPECDIKTTTAKPPIIDGVKISLREMDTDLDNVMLWKDYMTAQAKGNSKDLFWKVTVPFGILILVGLVICLLFTRHDSLFCQVCNRDYEVKQMQNYGHKDYEYS